MTLRALALSLALAAGLGACATVPAAPAGEINRIPIPGSDFPISVGVEVPPGAELLFVSGVVPGIIDTEADPNSREAYGDTRQQTVSVLSAMKERMEAAGWSMGDIVMMRRRGDRGPARLCRLHGRLFGILRHAGTAQQACPRRDGGRRPDPSGLARGDRGPGRAHA